MLFSLQGAPYRQDEMMIFLNFSFSVLGLELFSMRGGLDFVNNMKSTLFMSFNCKRPGMNEMLTGSPIYILGTDFQWFQENF